jgi:uncharacterized protein (TIGR03086 family)
MDNQISELLTRASAVSVPVIQGISDDQFECATPCAEYPVRELANHLFQVVVNFQALAAREQADFASKPDFLHGAWRQRYAEETGALIKAWSQPGALDGVSPGMGLPQPMVGRMVLLDLTVHSWDLARATGQEFTPDPASVSELFGLVEQMGPTGRERGVFKAAREVPAGAADFDRLLAATGRDPQWAGDVAPGR